MHGALQRFNRGGQHRTELDVPDNVTVHELLAGIGMDMNEPWNAGVDGSLAAPSDRLHEGARVVVFAPIEGG